MDENLKMIIGQIIGGVALFFLLSTYFKKNKTSVVKTMMLSNIFYIIHYFVLGALAGSLTLLIALPRDYYIYLREKHHKKHRHRVLYNNLFFFLIISALYVALALTQIENPVGMLPAVAGLIYFTGEWFGNKFYTKFTSGIVTIPWFIYDVISFSIPGMATDISSASACVIGLLRDDKKRRKK